MQEDCHCCGLPSLCGDKDGNTGSPVGHLPQPEQSPESWAGTGSDTELLVGPAVPTEMRLQQKRPAAVLGPWSDFGMLG